MKSIKFLQRIRKALNDPDRKPLPDIISEYARYKISKPLLAEQYFNKYLYSRHTPNTEDYVITTGLMKKIWRLNNPDFIPLMRNKQMTEIFFSRHGIPLVKSYAYNNHTMFFVDNEHVHIRDASGFVGFMHDLRARGLWKSPSMIIKKAEDSSQGYGIFKASYEEFQADKQLAQKLYKSFIQSRYLYQDFIVQHPDLNTLNPNSVNTLRIDTFTDRDNKIHVYNAALRISSGAAFLDSAPNGGIQVGVDLATGKLLHVAFGDFENGFARMYTHHPLTGIEFQGFQLPYFKESIELARTAASHLPEIKVAGWDIAIQPNGPVMVEGNNFPGISFSEISQRGFRNNEIVQKMIEEALSIK